MLRGRARGRELQKGSSREQRDVLTLRALALKGRAKTSDAVLGFVFGLPDGVAWNVPRSGAATTRRAARQAAALPPWSIAKKLPYSPNAIAAASLEQRVHDRVHGQLLEVRVLLADADEHDGLARLVRHTERGAYFVIYGIELGQY